MSDDGERRRERGFWEKPVSHLVSTIGAAAVAGALSVFGQMVILEGELASSDVEQSKIFLDRIDRLEHRLDDQAQQLAKLAIENAQLVAEKDQLKLKISLLESQDYYGPESRTAAVFDLFSEWRTAAWCKTITTGEDGKKIPVASYANPWFEFAYGISAESFVGTTDFDHFVKEQAAEYLKSDMRTYESKGWEDFLAPRPMSNGEVGPMVRFKKLYHDVKDGPELICGWEVE